MHALVPRHDGQRWTSRNSAVALNIGLDPSMHVDNAKTEFLAKLRQLLEQSGEADGTVDLAAWLEAWSQRPLD